MFIILDPKIVCVLGAILSLICGGIFFINADDYETKPQIIHQTNNQGEDNWIHAFNHDYEYEVFTISGTDIEVILDNENFDNFYQQCVDPCDYSSAVPKGYEYHGYFLITDSGTYSVTFDGDGELIVREWAYGFPISGMLLFMSMIGGIVILIIGLNALKKVPRIDKQEGTNSSEATDLNSERIDAAEDLIGEMMEADYVNSRDDFVAGGGSIEEWNRIHAEPQHVATITNDDNIITDIGDGISEILKKPFSRADDEDDSKLAMFDDNYMK